MEVTDFAHLTAFGTERIRSHHITAEIVKIRTRMRTISNSSVSLLSAGFGAGKITGGITTHVSSCMKVMMLNDVWSAAIDYGDEGEQRVGTHYLTPLFLKMIQDHGTEPSRSLPRRRYGRLDEAEKVQLREQPANVGLSSLSGQHH